MTESELLRLIAETDLDDLDVEQIELLRLRLKDSPRIRHALAQHVLFEQYLGGVLAQPEVSAEAIFAAAGPGRGGGGGWRWSPAWILIAVISLGVAFAIGLFRSETVDDTTPSDDVAIDATSDSGRPRVEPSPPDVGGAEERVPVVDAHRDDASDETNTDLVEVVARPFAETCFEDFPSVLDDEGRRGLGVWLETIGEKSRISTVRKQRQLMGTFAGLARLKPEWPPNAVLRLSLSEIHTLRLHILRSGQGVTLGYLPAERGWVAYRSREQVEDEEPAEKAPKNAGTRQINRRRRRRTDPVELLALLGTDASAWRRSGERTFELRSQDGELVMTCGDLVLLAVPFDGPPDEFLLEGRCSVRGVAMYHGAPAPRRRPVKPAENVNSEFPDRALSRLDWTLVGEHPELERRDDGSVRLATGATSTDARAFVKLSDDGETFGLKVVTLRLGDASVGSGFFLGTRDGRPLYRLGIFRDSASGRRTFGFLAAGSRATDSRFDAKRQIVPLVGAGQTIQLVLGPNLLSCRISTDGESFSSFLPPLRDVHGLEPFASVGLYALASKDARAIELASLQVSELDAITSHLPPELVDAASTVPAPRVDGERQLDSGAWLAAVLEKQPANVDFATWVRACAARTLGRRAPTSLSYALFSGMIEGVLADSRLDFESKARFLDQVALAADTWEASFAKRFSRYLVDAYTRLCASSSREIDGRVFTETHRLLVRSPMVSLELKETVSPDLVQCELLEMVHRGNWGEVRDLCERVRFWTGLGRDEGKPSSRYERILRHLKWAEGLAARHLPDEEGGALEPMPLALKHPLEAEYSKEGYNTIAEFDEALAGGAFEDACRIITASNRSAAIGLLPDARDSDLLVSLQAAVALAMRDHPGLRDVMEERFGDLGRLRVRQAMTRGDAPGVRSATVQFYGTTAAVEALIWLGDRGLAAGQLSRAVGSYLHASRHVAQVDHEDVAARLRLVGALEGKNVGAPVVRPIRMGTRSVTARDFEALVSRLREEREHSQEPGPFSVRPEDGGAPESGRYQTESVASFKVRDITRPSGLDNPRVDWVSAQLGVSLADDLVLVSERTQVHAHELSTGKRKWVQQGAGKRGQAQQWPLVSMRPLIVGSRAFCRFLKKNGPSLDCLDVRSGEVLWSAKGQDHVASDPMWVENRVVAVTATSQRDYVIELRLTAFDPISGEVVSETPLSRFRDAWNKQIPCRATSRLDRIVIAAGGSVLCTDSSGRMQWVRRQTWLPDGKRGRPEAEEAPSPLVVGGRVYVTQPGVPAFECLDLETGRLLWREFLPDATGVVGVVDEVLIMTLRDGLLGLDAGDGHRVWKRELDGMEAVRLGETRPELFALCSVTLDLQRGRRSPLLVWLDPRTGRETDSWPLGADGPLRQENLALGPFASDGDRVTFVAGRLGDRARSLFRLRRQGPSPAPSATTRRELDVWTDHVTGDEVLGRAARALFPAWTLVASPSNKAGGIVDETGGVKNVLVTHASKSRPVRFARSVDVPESGGAHVRLKVGRGDGDRWTLRVRVGGENLVDELIDETSAPLGWKEVDVDLGAYSGERVWLMVSQHVEKGRNGAACWKRIEVTQ